MIKVPLRKGFHNRMYSKDDVIIQSLEFKL